MSIRKQTLEEWFLAYQLKALQKNHVYNPIVLEADISKLESVYAERGERMPYTAVLIKALALAAEQHPCINRVFFSRPWGDCIVEPPTINVNFPHYITDEGREYLIASTVASANEKSVAEIKALIRESCQKKLAETIVAKHFKTNRNTLLKRLLLRLIHFVAYSFPKLYLTKGGGGLSVSSLLNHVEEGFL